MKKVLLVVLGIVVVAGGVLAFGLCSLVKVGSEELKPAVARLFEDVEAGRVEEAWKGASTEFQAAVPLEAFREMMAAVREVLGAWQGVGDVSGVSGRTGTGEPTTAEIQVGLRFARGTTEGEFRFVKHGERWLLLGLKVPFPPDLLPKKDPSALEGMARRVLEGLREARFVEVYDGFSAELKKAWPAAKFEADMRTIGERFGALGEATLKETREDEEGYVHLAFDVAFAKGAGTAGFKYLWRTTRWELLGLNLGR